MATIALLDCSRQVEVHQLTRSSVDIERPEKHDPSTVLVLLSNVEPHEGLEMTWEVPLAYCERALPKTYQQLDLPDRRYFTIKTDFRLCTEVMHDLEDRWLSRTQLPFLLLIITSQS